MHEATQNSVHDGPPAKDAKGPVGIESTGRIATEASAFIVATMLGNLRIAS